MVPVLSKQSVSTRARASRAVSDLASTFLRVKCIAPTAKATEVSKTNP